MASRLASVLVLVASSFAPLTVAAAPAWTDARVPGLELADARIATPPPSAVWGSADARAPQSRALARLRDEARSVWLTWDRARNCASGMMLAHVDAPGSVASASLAESFSRDFLARHLEAIAPGSDPDDFVVVANDLSSGIRTIGLQQLHRGAVVHGGGLGLRFVGDRLVMISATVLPDVDVPTALPGTIVLPVWDGSWRYHAVVREDVFSRAPLGHWWVYRALASGEPIAREQRMSDAVTVQFDVPQRYPVARYDAAAPQLSLLEGGNAAASDLAGQVAISGSPTQIEIAAVGPLVDVVNSAASDATTSFDVNDGDTVTWSLADDEWGDAQLSAFVHASLAKTYVRGIAPGFTWLDGTLYPNVNIDNNCNAVSDGNQLYFFRSGGGCENTARIADVVYHETGHSVHRYAIIEGVGVQQSSLSEGISDYLAATMTGDSGMGRGFNFTDDPLRELDPDGYEYMWPQDTGESHMEGRIIGGTLWDLRTVLQAKLGDAEGRAHTDHIWYESIRRAFDIPSMYPEALVADDDDGDLTNGTPNLCEINAVFEAHGLLDVAELATPEHALVEVDDGRQVVVTQSLPTFPDCPVGAGDVTLSWRLRDVPDDVTTVAMEMQDGGWAATIPTQAPGVVVEYQVVLAYDNGAEARLPRNAADPWYQTFFGGAQPIYCLDDAADLSQWMFAGDGGFWSFGPLGVAGIDPGEEWDDDGVVLSQDGSYPPWANTTATGPVIDLAGHVDVRLHMRRWLTVEDATFDHATVLANGSPIWANLATMQANTQHVDREWRFVDLPLVDALAAGSVQLQFALTSDGGLEFGGWTVDALCVVEVVDAYCGDDMVSGNEECDDGNTEPGDGCDASCMMEDPDPSTSGGSESADTSGDGTADEGSASITGATGSTFTTTAGDGTDDSTGDANQDGESSDGCGCTTDARPGLPLALLLLLPLRRRVRVRAAGA